MPDILAPAITLDTSLSALLIETDDDETFRGITGIFKLQMFGDEVVADESADTLRVVINLNRQVLFDMSTYSVVPLTCSPLDATWFLPLPDVFDPEIQTVKIEMQPD